MAGEETEEKEMMKTRADGAMAAAVRRNLSKKISAKRPRRAAIRNISVSK
jgi:hypothetical protein